MKSVRNDSINDHSTWFMPFITMNHASQLSIMPAIHGPWSSTLSLSWESSRMAARNTRCARNPAIPLITIENTIAEITVPTVPHWTTSAPWSPRVVTARPNDAPIRENIRHAVLLTGIPKAEYE